jgi:hypothetical protein
VDILAQLHMLVEVDLEQPEDLAPVVAERAVADLSGTTTAL